MIFRGFMVKKVNLKYGKRTVSFQVPEPAALLTVKDPVYNVDEDRFKMEAAGMLPLDIGQMKSIAVVVADKTRRCGYERYLPLLLDVFLERGVPEKAIRFYIAYGTHKKQTEKECLDVYGAVYNEFEFVHHDCRDGGAFEYCGRTRKGTAVHIRKDILESDLVITFGALSHHYFAGYGGGRKLLFPGLGYAPDIYRNHSLFLDAQKKQLSKGCRPGNLEGNPLAEDLKEIDGFLTSPRISIHGILDSASKVCRLLVADGWDGFEKGCGTLDKFYKSSAEKSFSLVIASCGGHPKDINFIQSHKALNNAAMFVRDGGNLVLLAKCPDGIGSDTFLPYFEYGTFEQAFEKLHQDYKGNGGTALSMMSKSRRINIFLKTDLDDTICGAVGVKKIEDIEMNNLIDRYGHDMACIENGGLLIR